MSASQHVSHQVDLEFGVFDWIDKAGDRPTADVYDGRLAMVQRVDEGNFSRYHVAEHHGAPIGLAPSPGLFLAAAARITSRIRLTATTYVLPLYDPLRLVQEIAMLDQLSRGRVEIGIGKGSSPQEAAMFGHAPADMADRYERFMPTILDALRTGVFQAVDADGEPTGSPVPLVVKAFQTPQPPLWYPTSNPASIPRLAREGFHTIFGFGFTSPPLEEIRKHSDVFFEVNSASTEQDGNQTGATPRFGMLRHVFVGETDEAAEAIARPAFAEHYRNFTHLWRESGSDRFSGDLDFDELIAKHLLFVGSAETVADQLSHAVDVAGVNYFAGSFAWGDLSAENALSSLSLFDEVVIPRVRAILQDKKATASGVGGRG